MKTRNRRLAALLVIDPKFLAPAFVADAFKQLWSLSEFDQEVYLTEQETMITESIDAILNTVEGEQ